MFDFRRIRLFCLEKRLTKHKMTIFSKNLGGMAPLPPLATPMSGALTFSSMISHTLPESMKQFFQVPYLFDCKLRLYNFFHYFVRLITKGGLHFLFLYFIERYRWRSVFRWRRFFDQTLISHYIFFSITCTSVTGGIIINRRQFWLCEHHYQGYE